jgi:hypothetical protein
MKTLIKLALFIFVSLALSPVFGDAAWLIVGIGWLLCIGIKEWFDGIEERERKAQGMEVVRQLAAMQAELERRAGMRD